MISLAKQIRPASQTASKTLAERLGYPRDAKLLIVHADIYQNKALFDTLLRVARENKLPIRVSRELVASISFLPSLLTPDDVVIDSIISIEPSVSPEGWSKYYTDAIKSLPPGVTEMIVHLAYDDEEMRGLAFAHPNWGSEWRQRDFQFVTSDAFRKLLQENNVRLITWREVGKLLRKSEK